MPRRPSRSTLQAVQPDPDTTLDLVTFKASHNSYESSGGSLTSQLDWNPALPQLGGCRGVELDARPTRDGGEWKVGHRWWIFEVGRPAHTLLRSYLDELMAWIDDSQSPGRGPVWITLQVDGYARDVPGFPEQLDRYIARSIPPGRIWGPKDMLTSGQSDLVLAFAQHGAVWPSLDSLRSKFVVCLTGEDQAKSEYSKYVPESRLCFADKAGFRVSKNSPPIAQGSRIVFNIDATEYLREREVSPSTTPRTTKDLERELRWYREHPGLMTRVFGVNDPERWEKARRGGANIIATNSIAVKNRKWATADPDRAGPFYTAGSPARRTA